MLFFGARSLPWIKSAIDHAVVLLQLVQEIRTDGQQVRSSQTDDLIQVPEAGAHHLSFVAELLVVVVNTRDRDHAGILVVGNVLAAVLLVPIVNAADEGGNQSDF